MAGFSLPRKHLSRIVWRIGEVLAPVEDPTEIRVRVLGGPARGRLLAVPTRERPSMVLGCYERKVVRCIRDAMTRGSVFYDIGAHVGYLSLIASPLVGDVGYVYSAEANPELEVFLRENFVKNGMTNARSHNIAISDKDGSVAFATFTYSLVGHIAGPNTPKDAKIVQVPSATVDSLVESGRWRPPNLMKIDVEGAETEVVRGSLRVLERYRPALIIEVRLDDTYPLIEDMLIGVGYRSQVINRHSGESATLADVLFSP